MSRAAMLIDRFMPRPDAVEVHALVIEAPPQAVYRALWATDFGGSWLVKGLLGLRALPALLSSRARRRGAPRRLDLEAVIAAGFGRLAEDPGRELVLGVVGRFWRPADNLLPFDRAAFDGPVPPGTARAVWNFSLRPAGSGGCELSTETRVQCGDRRSRRKFRLYWLAVRPFSGLIRRLMLRRIRRTALATPSGRKLSRR